MKLRYHLDRKEDGLVVLESEPQMRSLFVYSQSGNTKRVPLPYVQFVVRYKKAENKQLFYPGIYGCGLHVFCHAEPVTSFNDRVCYLPTDAGAGRQGLICTNHSYDNQSYKSLSALVSEVVGLWYGHQHQFDYQPFANYKWHEATVEMLPKATWQPAGTFLEALHRNKSYGKPLLEINAPLDVKFVTEDWPKKLEVAPYVPDPALKVKAPTISDEWGGCDCPECRQARKRRQDDDD